MPNPEYVIETVGKQAGLAFHLETAFYPLLPDQVRQGFMSVFTEYWNHQLDFKDLNQALSDRAWYTGGWEKYNFHMFINKEDLQ